MRVFIDFACVKCRKKEEFYIEPEQVSDYEANVTCKKCGGHLKKVWAFGYGKMKGNGYTRHYIK